MYSWGGKGWEDVEEEMNILRRNTPEFNMRDLEIQEAVQSSMK